MLLDGAVRKDLSAAISVDGDVVTIYGIKYSGDLFRGLGLETPVGKAFRIVKREDGVVTIETVDAAP